MTADLAGELDRLDKAATPGPWEPTPNDGVLAHLEPPEDVPGMHRIAEAVYSRDVDLVVWLRNHTDEIKAALADEGWDEAMCDVYIAREHADLVAERDRLRATVQRVELLADNGYEAHYDSPGASERVCVDLVDLRAALNGGE